MNLLASSKLTEKKSKFFSFLYAITNEDEIKEVISFMKKEHQKADHICYGVILKKDEAFKNDGEVGQPGRALLEVLKEKNKSSHILLVVRYFGGIKLGPGGVSRAFRAAGRYCLDELK